MTTATNTFEPGWLTFLDAPVERPRTRAVLLSALAIGISFDIAMRAGIDGVAGALCVFLASATLIASGRLRSTTSLILVGAAPFFGTWLAIRTSDWLLPLDVLASCALVVLGCSLASGGSLWDLSLPRAVMRGTQAIAQLIFTPRFLFGTQSERGRIAPVVRGIAIAVPVVLIAGALLASADAVFASFVDIDISDGVQHAVLIAFGTFAMAWLLRIASLRDVESPTVTGMRLGTTEWTIVLGALNAMLGAFAVAQLVALSEGGERILKSAGLTYADYARSGFFQLVGAAIVITTTLLLLRATAERGTRVKDRSFRLLALTTVVFTLLIVLTAFQRLRLYEGGYGLTMLRLYVHAAIVWIGLFCVMLALTLLDVGGKRQWLWPVAGVAALAFVFAMNVLNPEAFVARYNIEHADELGRFDPAYVSGLSADAVPVLHERFDDALLCGRPERPGWAAFNVSRDRAAEICEGG